MPTVISKPPRKIIIAKGGQHIRFIHNDRMNQLVQHNDTRANPVPIRRASNVEPGDPARGQNPTLWYADMAPVGGPILTPCTSRQAALDAEVIWLNQNNLGVTP